MKEEKILEDKFGRKGPWTVPDGYFDAMRDEVMSKLPEYPSVPKKPDLSVWQRIKPYVYLAAMFAGIWCMMNIFHRVSDNTGSLSLDNPPAHIAAYVGQLEDDDIYIAASTDSDVEMMDEVSDSYNSIQDFEKDFGYELKPEYAQIDL